MNQLWDILPHPYPESVVRLAWREGGRLGGDYARGPKGIDRFIRVCAGRNVYVAPNPTESTIGVRHTAEDVSHWSYFLIDVDPVEDVNDPMPVLEEALLWLGEWNGRDFAKTRPVIIDSGRGAQAWIRLDDVPMLPEGFMFAGAIWTEECQRIPGVCGAVGTTRRVARKTQGYWLGRLAEKIGTMHGCRIDTSTSDLPRLMRCPGTVNQKTGRAAYIVDPGGAPNRGLATLLIQGTPKRVFEEIKYDGAPGRTWQDAFGDLTRKAQVYLTEGQEEPGRHAVVWHTAKSLCERGVTKDEARRALLYANSIRGEEQELEADQIENALKTAFLT